MTNGVGRVFFGVVYVGSDMLGFTGDKVRKTNGRSTEDDGAVIQALSSNPLFPRWKES